MKRPETITSPDMVVGLTTDKMVAPDIQFHRVSNLYPSEEGGLVSVYGPTPYVPKPTTGGAPDNSGSPDPSIPEYGTTYGLFHCRLKGGERDVLLLQTIDEIWEFRGWSRDWHALIAPSGGVITAQLPRPTPTDYPTQFVATNTGVVIVPPGGRAYFYDGIAILPLGYDRAPAPPIGMGPENSAPTFFPDANVREMGVNDAGYCMDSLDQHQPSAMAAVFRQGRVGTVTTPGNVSVLADTAETDNPAQVMGYLEPGRYRARTQWVDRWGNLSALSGDSNDVKFSRQPAMGFTLTVPCTMFWVHADKVLKEIAWDGVCKGPQGTIGRLIHRTKDLENAGDVNFYELPSDAAVTDGKFATLPDNTCDTYPDNIPDSWLANKAVEVEPIPIFRLAELAFGRLWMAVDGRLYYSMVGRYGTIQKGSVLVPDPTGGEITGLKMITRGLLVFTATSMYLVESNDQGDSFRSAPLDTTIGCVAPSSIVTMRNGVTVWLGSDGFYGIADGTPSFLFTDHRLEAKRFNRARMCKAVAAFDHHSGQYRCWVSMDGAAKNNRCWTYSGTDWNQRNDIAASGVCVTNDHRKLMLASGVPNATDGVWVVDRGGPIVASQIVTGWIRSERSRERSSLRRVMLKLRETAISTSSDDKILVSIRRDYRAEIVSTARVETYPALSPDYTDPPDSFASASFGSAKWRRRRPYEAVADVDIPSCEVFQIVITCPAKFEILKLAFEEQPREAGGAMSHR